MWETRKREKEKKSLIRSLRSTRRSSAAQSLVKLRDFFVKSGILFCVFVTGRGGEAGFPCTFELTESLRTDAVVSSDLDSALAFVEDGLIALQAPGLEKENFVDYAHRSRLMVVGVGGGGQR